MVLSVDMYLGPSSFCGGGGGLPPTIPFLLAITRTTLTS